MKTSAYELSTSQKWIFPILLILALVFGSCSESAVNPVEDAAPANQLQGTWTELENAEQINKVSSSEYGKAVLRMNPTSGILQLDSDEGSIHMMFEYQIINSNVLQIIKTRFQVEGQPQPSGERELVFYSLYDGKNALRIFDRTFVRQ